MILVHFPSTTMVKISISVSYKMGIHCVILLMVGKNVILTVQVAFSWQFEYNNVQLFQLKFVRPLVSSPSPTTEHTMMHVSHMTMMAHHGVMLVMVKRTTVHLPVQVTIC